MWGSSGGLLIAAQKKTCFSLVNFKDLQEKEVSLEALEKQLTENLKELKDIRL